MPAAVATPTILTDPGYLFWAPLATAEPIHAAAASTYAADPWPVAWIPLGATEDGAEFSYEINVEAITVAEFFDPIRYSTTERTGSFSFNLASWTLNNVKKVMNGGTISTVSGTAATLSSKFLPPAPGAETRCMIGWESLDSTTRLVCYQTLNATSVTSAFRKAPAFSVLPCQFQFEVPASGQPFAFYAAGTSRLGT